MITKIFSLLMLVTPLMCEDLVIHVPTQKKLQPAYVTEIHAKASPFERDYPKQLQEVLKFDFQHNGRTSVVDSNPEAEKILADEKYQRAFYPKMLQDLHVSYVVQARIEGKQLLTSVYVASSSVLKHFKTLELSGHLCDDRRLIHRLADGIFQDLFKSKGIASTQVLYAYQTSWKTDASEIWQCDYDGGNAHPITHEGVQSVSPQPYTAERFVYACYKSGQTKIYAKRFDERLGTPCITLSGSQFHPRMNADMSALAFTSDHLGRNDLFLQQLKNGDPIGRPQQLYAFPKSVTASPCFSPDGKQIAFVSDQSGNPKIYLIDVPVNAKPHKRPEAKLLTNKHNACVCPAWSPDGQKIAYSAKIEGIRQIWIYDLQSKGTIQLTSGPHHKENPTWAPDSHHLMYNTTDGDIYDLYLINLNDPTPARITNGSGIKHYPSWGS